MTKVVRHCQQIEKEFAGKLEKDLDQTLKAFDPPLGKEEKLWN